MEPATTGHTSCGRRIPMLQRATTSTEYTYTGSSRTTGSAWRANHRPIRFRIALSTTTPTRLFRSGSTTTSSRARTTRWTSTRTAWRWTFRATRGSGASAGRAAALALTRLWRAASPATKRSPELPNVDTPTTAAIPTSTSAYTLTELSACRASTRQHSVMTTSGSPSTTRK